MVDGTYRVNRHGFPLYTLMVKDGNGHGQAVGQALLVNEKKDALEHFFTEHHRIAGSKSPETVIVDKDFNEIHVIKKIWPEASVLLCRFHALKAFRTTLQQMEVPSHQKEAVKPLLQRLVYAKTQSEYDNVRNGLASVAPQIFMEYFNKNWDSCQEMWAFHATKNLVQYNTYTNNFLESRHNKLKATLKPSMSVPDCLKEIVKFQLSQDVDNLGAAMRNSLKRHYFVGECEEEKQNIRNLLTPLAASNVIKQLELAKKISTSCTAALDGDVAVVNVCGESYHITDFPERPSCQCSFSKSQQLPCLHIMVAALNFDQPIFREDWIPSRWQKCFQLPDLPKSSSAVNIKFCPRAALPKGKSDRFKELHRLLRVIADASSDVGGSEFAARYELLQQLASFWASGKAVALVVCNIVSMSSTHSNAFALTSLAFASIIFFWWPGM